MVKYYAIKLRIQLCILLLFSCFDTVLPTNREKKPQRIDCGERRTTWTPQHGDVVTIRDHGHEPSARYDATDGTWRLLSDDDDDDDVRCGAASCPDLVETSDPNLIFSSSFDTIPIRGKYEAGTVLEFDCKAGYEPSHGSRLTCLDTGTWNLPPPTCSVVRDLVTIVYVAENESGVFRCVDDTLDTFLDNWIWMKDQRLLKPDGDLELENVTLILFTASLNVTRMRKSLEGIYTCVSMDFVGVTRHRSVLLLSTQHEEFAFDVAPRNMIVAKKKFAVLFCSARNAEIRWYRDKKTLRADGRHYDILPNGALMIYDADVSVNGNYTCVAENAVTKKRITKSVTVDVDFEVDEICGKPRMSRSSKYDRHPLRRKSKVVGGKEADRGSHPWMTLIAVQKVNGERKFCGGSLVDRYWVVTAAHCLDNVTDGQSGSWIRVTLGKHTRQEKDNNEQVYDVAETVIHAFYNGTTFDNDLALLRLSRKVHFTDYIVPICLPPSSFMNHFYPAVIKRINGTVAGWGRLRDRGILSEYLREVRLPIVDIYECDRSAGEIVGKNVFCAGVATGEVDSCEGDSGGAFEIDYEGRTYLAGIVSWGIDCGRPRMYGFYTRVDRYIDYIEAYVYRTEKWFEYDTN